ncbi:hypothetical protein [Pseudomonas costantinii]|nr:hypothetical protein [Pseudomonas costantinii]SED27427.1 hypothetical protein SAMN04515675_0522 [Pseudomonas costantinii]
MSKPNGGAAFPGTYTARSDQGRGPVTEFHDKGMSLRDYFAAKAMQGMLAVPDDQRYGDRADKSLTVEQWQQWCVTGVVEHAYRVADAMLAARSA